MLSFMDKDTAALLREIKDASGWSETRIAEKIGSSQPTVNRILHGQPDCKVSTLRAIEKLYQAVVRPRRRKKTATITS
jgi:transcriptional regulator with XRE-family HTH domain